MDNPVDHIVSLIRRNASAARVYLVGIDGLGGSGKSYLAKEIRQELEAERFAVDIVHHDDFYLPSDSRISGSADIKPIGCDFDWMRLRDQVLIPLKSGRIAQYARYDWPSDKIAEEHLIQPRGIVLVEGVYCTRKEIRSFYDFCILIECAPELRLKRGLSRDGESVRSVWLNEWAPAEDRYYKEHRPFDFAHLIIDGTRQI